MFSGFQTGIHLSECKCKHPYICHCLLHLVKVVRLPLFACPSYQEACSRREINEPSGMASPRCCRGSTKAAIPTVISPRPTAFSRYLHNTCSTSRGITRSCHLCVWVFFLWDFSLHVVNVFLSGIIIPALHGGHVFRYGGQEDRSGIHLPQHVHLWPLRWSGCKLDIPGAWLSVIIGRRTETSYWRICRDV